MSEYACAYCSQFFLLAKKQRKSLIPEAEVFCSVDCVRHYLMTFPVSDPPTDPQGAIRVSTYSEVYDLYDDLTQQGYRSWYEIHVARFLRLAGFEFKYESFVIEVGKATYTPDFWLPVQGTFIEVKGLWGMSSKTKFKKARAAGHNITLLPWHLAKEFRSLYSKKIEFGTIK